MKVTSRFLFTGSAVLALLAFVFESWLMLPVAFFVAFFGMLVADREQLADMDQTALAMMLAMPEQRPLQTLDDFRCQELLFYSAGYPVYRYLIASDSCWELVGEESQVKAERGMIRVFPGFLYRRVAR